MSLSLSHGKPIDPTPNGLRQEELPSPDAGTIDLRQWFACPSNDLELEIGSGKGTFLVQQAAQRPNVNYIGLEYAKGFWAYAADRCRRHQLANVKLVRIEADLFIRRYVPDNVFAQVHIYFPDPWPKSRHHKRRLIQDAFLQQLHRILRPDGLVRFATDHMDYFQWTADKADRAGSLFERLPFERPESAQDGELVGTNFERKYRREGRPFAGLILKRLENPGT